LHRKLAIGGATVAAFLAFAVPAAMADTTVPVTLSFNNVVLDTPATPDAQVVSPTTQPLTATADVDTTTGAFTIQPSAFSVPTYNFTSPVTGSASLALNGPATGTVDFATGAVTMNADILATISITGDGSCTIDTGALTLSTATTEPLAGEDFPAGTTGVASGNGAFGAGWSSLPAGTGPACTLVDAAVDNGSGGIWIARVTPAKLAATVTKPKSVKVGKTASVDVALANTGGADTASVKVCLAAKSPLSPTSKCVTVAKPAAGSKHKLVFKINTKKAKAGTYKLTLTATGLKTQTTTLKVTK
jgi:hypothetical protein